MPGAPKGARGVSLPPAVQARIRQMMAEIGETESAKRLKISIPTLSRCLAGLPVQPATCDAVTARLRESEEATAEARARRAAAALAQSRANVEGSHAVLAAIATAREPT